RPDAAVVAGDLEEVGRPDLFRLVGMRSESRGDLRVEELLRGLGNLGHVVSPTLCRLVTRGSQTPLGTTPIEEVSRRGVHRSWARHHTIALDARRTLVALTRAEVQAIVDDQRTREAHAAAHQTLIGEDLAAVHVDAEQAPGLLG